MRQQGSEIVATELRISASENALVSLKYLISRLIRKITSQKRRVNPQFASLTPGRFKNKAQTGFFCNGDAILTGTS